MKKRPALWTTAHRLVALGFLTLLVLASTGAIGWLSGSTSATRLFGLVPFVDPLAALEAALAAREVTPTMLVGAGLLVFLALLLGPVFCGWLCPLGLALDLNHGLRTWVLRRLRPRRAERPARTPIPVGVRILLLGVVAGAAFAARLPLFQVVSPINLLVRSLLFAAGLGLVLPLALLVLEWIWPRAWCRSLCPLGALYALLGRWAPFRVRIDPVEAGRLPCRRCTIRCPMGIRVMEDWTLAGRRSVDDEACTRCGTCLDACPRGVLSLGVRDLPLPEDEAEP